jgi:hypothetical protein
MSTTDIHDHVEAICETFGIASNLVARITLTPGHALVTAYVKDDNGRFVIDDHEALTEVHHYDTNI